MRIGPLGIWEILIILVVVLLIFGPRRLPEMAKGIGQSVREFRKGIKDLREDITKDDEPKKATVVESPTSPSVTPAVSQVSVSPAASVAPQSIPQAEVHTVSTEKEEVKSA